jgi:hypothetical protein
MPYSSFVWLREEEIAAKDWTQMTDEQEEGYILEVL